MTRYASETDEQCAVVEYCDLRGIPVVHIPNGASAACDTARNSNEWECEKDFRTCLFPWRARDIMVCS